MKYKYTAIVGLTTIGLTTLGVAMAITNNSPQIPTSTHTTAAVKSKTPDSLTPSEIASVTDSEPVIVTPVPVAAAVAPETQSPPNNQTAVDWWRSVKANYSEEDASAMLGIILRLGIPAGSDPQVLQTQLDYALAHYGTLTAANTRLALVAQNKQLTY